MRRAARTGNRRGVGTRRPTPGLPEVTVIECIGQDEDGVLLAHPVAWAGPDPPLLRIIEDGPEAALPIGARAAARLCPRDTGEIDASILRRLDRAGERIVGILRIGQDGIRLVSAERRDRAEYQILERDAGGAAAGELVVGQRLAVARFGLPRARIVERLGSASDAGAISRLVLAAADIPVEFPQPAIDEAEIAIAAGLDGRADLRALPLVTIDGSDARDFDDAVWAEPDRSGANPGGWHLVVAIADVAWYVRPGTALDREAARRGNSVYFPDRVVPMLPEALSAGLCSLQPGAERACIAAHLWIDAAGQKRGHRFERALMRSAARLTYEEVEAARQGRGVLPLPPELLASLYGAWAALARARAERGALELELREDRVVLDAEGRPTAVVPIAHLDSHRLIEEFMILANVAAAEEIETRRQACLYRVHDAPDPAKLIELRDALDSLGLPGIALARGQPPHPQLFNRLLRRVAASPAAPLVNELVLRAQAQAAYSPQNIGHFGLALRRYAHFTSPIRRYADLVVHRALIAGANRTGDRFGDGGAPPGRNDDRLAAIAAHVSATERRAAAAEREALDRYRAALTAPAIGRLFAARISGIAGSGVFVTTAENGAQGFVPASSLPGDYYERDRRAQRLVGRRSGRSFRLGDDIAVRLVQADAISGRLVFRLEESESEAPRHSVRRARRRRRD